MNTIKWRIFLVLFTPIVCLCGMKATDISDTPDLDKLTDSMILSESSEEQLNALRLFNSTFCSHEWGVINEPKPMDHIIEFWADYADVCNLIHEKLKIEPKAFDKMVVEPGERRKLGMRILARLHPHIVSISTISPEGPSTIRFDITPIRQRVFRDLIKAGDLETVRTYVGNHALSIDGMESYLEPFIHNSDEATEIEVLHRLGRQEKTKFSDESFQKIKRIALDPIKSDAYRHAAISALAGMNTDAADEILLSILFAPDVSPHNLWTWAGQGLFYNAETVNKSNVKKAYLQFYPEDTGDSHNWEYEVPAKFLERAELLSLITDDCSSGDPERITRALMYGQHVMFHDLSSAYCTVFTNTHLPKSVRMNALVRAQRFPGADLGDCIFEFIKEMGLEDARHTVKMMGRNPRSSFVSAVVQFADLHPDPHSLLAAVHALGEIGDPSAIPKLIEIAEMPDLPESLAFRAVVTNALGNIGHPDSLPFLFESLKHPDNYSVICAIHGCRKYKADTVIPHIKPFLYKENSRVVSVDTLIAFGTSDAIEMVEKALPTFDEKYQQHVRQKIKERLAPPTNNPLHYTMPLSMEAIDRMIEQGFITVSFSQTTPEKSP